MNIQNNNFIGGSSFWLNSSEMDFHEIQKKSSVTSKWLIKDNQYDNKIIQPINKYSSLFSKFPEIFIQDDNLILRQKTHAEIWVQPMNKFLYAVDKTMQRQFYPSDKKFIKQEDCFLSSYKFYTPWIIDYDITCEVKSISESPFFINSQTIEFKKNYGENNNFCWIYFYIKKHGIHMHNKKYGIIEIETPMFDIIVKDKNIRKRILDQYG